MLYQFEIREVCTQRVEVEANSQEEAEAMVEASYWKNPADFTLEPEDTEIVFIKQYAPEDGGRCVSLEAITTQ